MNKTVIGIAGLAILAMLLAGCRVRLSGEDPIPAKFLKSIRSLDEITAPMTESVPQAVIAVTIVQANANINGTVGKVCDAITLVEPNVAKQLTLHTAGDAAGDRSTLKALEELLARFDQIRRGLRCEAVADSRD